MNVLLADRSPVVLDRLTRLLADLPCVRVVSQARDSEEARAQVRACKPDVVVIDLCLDGRSGLPLLRDIKACELPPYLIVLTIDLSSTFVEHCLEVADVCLDKTNDLDALIDTLRSRCRDAGEQCPADADCHHGRPGGALHSFRHGAA